MSGVDVSAAVANIGSTIMDTAVVTGNATITGINIMDTVVVTGDATITGIIIL